MEEFKKPQVSKWIVYSFMVSMIFFGTFASFIMKRQDEYKTSEGYFTHPFIQCFFMFSGDATCLGIFTLFNYIKTKFAVIRGTPQEKQQIRANEDQDLETPSSSVASDIVIIGKNDINSRPRSSLCKTIFFWGVPAVLDSFAMSLFFYAMVFIPVSVYQMMGDLMLIIAALFSICMLGRKYYRHHWTGMGIIIVGLCIVTFCTTEHTKSNKETIKSTAETNWAGVILMGAGCLIESYQMVLEEKYFVKLETHPMQALGYQGITGILWLLILFPFLQFIPCPTLKNGTHEVCTDGVVEDSAKALKQLFQNPGLLGLAMLLVFAFSSYKFVGLSVTKYASATSRMTMACARTVCVWLAATIIGWEDILLLQCIGYVLTVFGIILYNEFVVLPCMGFNLYTRSRLERMKIPSTESAPIDSETPKVLKATNKIFEDLDEDKKRDI